MVLHTTVCKNHNPPLASQCFPKKHGVHEMSCTNVGGNTFYKFDFNSWMALLAGTPRQDTWLIRGRKKHTERL